MFLSASKPQMSLLSSPRRVKAEAADGSDLAKGCMPSEMTADDFEPIADAEDVTEVVVQATEKDDAAAVADRREAAVAIDELKREFVLPMACCTVMPVMPWCGFVPEVTFGVVTLAMSEVVVTVVVFRV
jgi:hypothetical protein